MLLLGIWTTPAVGFAAFAVIGFGNAFVDVGVFTLVARLVPPPLLGRAFAALEVVITLSVTAGSWVAGLAIEQLGVEALLVGVGALLVVLPLAYSGQTTRLDRQLEPAEHAETLRECSILSTLPTVSIDYLASVGQEHTHADGDVVMHQGEPGVDFHVVVSGAAIALIDGTPVGYLAEGDGFGEIALLRDVPRTATVVADGTLRTLSVHREDFLMFVVGHPASVTALSDIASSRERENARRLTDS
jgi:MFS family permease